MARLEFGVSDLTIWSTLGLPCAWATGLLMHAAATAAAASRVVVNRMTGSSAGVPDNRMVASQ